MENWLRIGKPPLQTYETSFNPMRYKAIAYRSQNNLQDLIHMKVEK